MIRFSNFASLLQLRSAALSVSVAVLFLATAASAADLDFNVANGNYNVASNWIDQGDPLAVPPVDPAPPATPPTISDRAFVRNNGTLLINSNVQNLQMRIGYERELTTADYDGNGFVDAADYVLWRNGGPLLNDATPSSVGPDDYRYWRSTFGAPGGLQNLGGTGTLNWTAGEITGQGPIGGDPYSGGPDIRVGRLDTTATPQGTVQYEFTGTVVQNGPTTKLLLPFQQSQLTIGDGVGFVSNPTSSYTLMDGTIGLGIGSTVYQNNGTNGNNGIHVRNGTFNMTGGQIIDATPTDYLAFPLTTQRFLTVATATGGGVGSESVATANLSGGSINVLGGIRVATANHSRGYVNINGPITILTGGDTSIGYQPTTGGVNAVGEMNMSAGSFTVGNSTLTGRFQIGDRGKGILNMSGGTINVTRNIRVTNNAAAAGSIITMTGGTMTTPNLEMRVAVPAAADVDVAASVIVDGPTASFVQTTSAGSTGATIGNNGKALFEIRQGTALLGGGGSTVQLGSSAISAATLNVMGGKLTVGGPVNRSNLASVVPVIGLTGGTLELSPPAAFQAWQTNFPNSGSQIITKPGALLQVQVGGASPAIPGDFSMSSGSWNIDIGSHTTLGGADWFNVPNGTSSLTGGTLNISYLAGFTPNPNEVFTIIKSSGAATLSAGSVTIAGAGAPNWVLQTAGGTDIQLRYTGAGSAVPEPSTMVLVGLLASAQLVSRRARRSKT